MKTGPNFWENGDPCAEKYDLTEYDAKYLISRSIVPLPDGAIPNKLPFKRT